MSTLFKVGQMSVGQTSVGQTSVAEKSRHHNPSIGGSLRLLGQIVCCRTKILSWSR